MRHDFREIHEKHNGRQQAEIGDDRSRRRCENRAKHAIVQPPHQAHDRKRPDEREQPPRIRHELSGVPRQHEGRAYLREREADYDIGKRLEPVNEMLVAVVSAGHTMTSPRICFARQLSSVLIATSACPPSRRTWCNERMMISASASSREISANAPGLSAIRARIT